MPRPADLWLTGLSGFVSEYQFHPTRRWRFDWCFPERKLAIECDGGVWVQGRHSRGAGQIKDMEKLNEATILGWRVLRFTPQQIKSGEAYLVVSRALLS